LTDIKDLCDRLLKGDKRAAARLLTMVENRLPQAQKAIAEIYKHTGHAHIVGITGPPGVGKSTLIEKLIREIRAQGETVGVIAVDPTSPFSGGAFLGDRVRMQSLSTDEGVFIRSMATRGGVGGLSRATRDAVRVLDAYGADIVIVETVGAGQSEVEVIKVAETVVVVLSPGVGDEIQALKAGMMEIGDLFVVNKADLEGADRVLVDVRRTLEMRSPGVPWIPPVLKAVAKTGEGVPKLLEGMRDHREHLKTDGRGDERERMEEELTTIIREKAAEHLLSTLKKSKRLTETVERVLNTKVDPYTAVEELLSSALPTPQEKDRAGGLERGLVQVYTGNGKGKTSAALGLALRALGRGLKVYVIQFIKGDRDYGEIIMAREIPGLEMVTYGRGKFIDEESRTQKDAELAQEALEHAREIITSGNHDVVILDEVNIAMSLGLLEPRSVIQLARDKPPDIELIMTGRGAPDEIIDIADLVTEMREVRHPYGKGVKARRGIEY
jgi:LAO/AO transport system kinase